METYRRDASWEENLRLGPRFEGEPAPVPSTPRKDFFGYSVSSRLGIAAGLLLDARWVALYARLGFDLLTYKTVRSAARPSYPPPNWLRVAPEGGGARGVDPRADERLVVREGPFPEGPFPEGGAEPDEFTSAVCFGMPSQEPSAWRRDVAHAREALGSGQILIVSVVGTPAPGAGADSLIEDYARCARWAAESGAHIVEANLSCPNVCSAEGSIYQDPRLSGRVAEALRQAVPSLPLFLKAGYLDEQGMRPFLEAVAPHVDAVLHVNGLARRVFDARGGPAFGEFERVGILGPGVHGAALEALRRASALGRELGVASLGVGGVYRAQDAEEFFAAGAAGVLLGSAPMFRPGLARELKGLHPEW